MGFVHAKNARVYVDAFDMSKYFNEASMQAKVDLADSTTFAPVPGVTVAKTVVPGIKDGTLSLKGLFDSTPQTLSLTNGSTTGSDAYFLNLLTDETGSAAAQTASNVEGIVSVAPEGSWAPGKRVWAATNVVTDYSISSPIKNVVSSTASMQCDGGVMTGVSLKDPATSDTFPTTYGTAVAGLTLPYAAINVAANVVGYPASGSLLVPIAASGYAVVTYTAVANSRTDTATVTSGSSTISDTSIVASDLGRAVSGTGIPASSYVGTVTAGTSFVLVNAAGAAVNATSAGTSITLGPAFTGSTGGSGVTAANPVVPLNFGTGVNDESLPSESTQGPTATVAAAITLTAATFNLTVTQNPITQGFPRSGQILVPISGSTVTLTYSGLSATQFLNCSGGGGQATVAGTITLAPIASTMGAYAFMHVNQVAGAGSTGVVYAKLQHSDDNSTWSDVAGSTWTFTSFGLGQYGSGQYGGGSTPGGYILALPQGTQILRYVRVAIGYSGSSTSSAVLVTFVRL